MLLPYCIERPIKRAPVCTYALMAINVVVFLAMTIHANIILSNQKADYTDKSSVFAQIINDARATSNDVSNSVTDAASPDNAVSNGVANDVAADTEQQALREMQDDPTMSAAMNLGALKDKVEAGSASQDEVLQLQSIVWRAQHAGDAFTFDPHPTAYKWLAYWIGAPSLLGFFMSMFVHGGLEHIAGNMLFLWLFGRALEDALGPLIYTLAYLVCGVAAVLLYHITTQVIMPHATMVPFVGASGAIAGLQGLFAPRFYRTQVRVFYTTYMGFVAMGLVGGVFGALIAGFIGSDGYFIGAIIAIAGIVWWGEDTLWGEFSAAAAWVLGGFFVWNDVLPVMIEIYMGRSIDGVAHWAHIGGFLCGVAYAFLVGLTGEAKTEFLTEDARASLEKNHGTSALEYAQDLLKHKPGDPNALRLIAEALDTKGKGLHSDGMAHSEKAADAWEAAILAFEKAGDRDGAAGAYNQAMAKHNSFIMPPKIQFDLGSHMARHGDNIGAAQTLVKIPFTFPDAPEGELALLRGAQLYAQHLHDATMANYLLTTLLQRYPNSQWRAQAEAGLKTTQQKMDEERTSLSQDASKQTMPVEVPVAQKPFSAAKK